ncbi:hypothetical protein KIN20_007287 [Parelaphostrongylus tenuis]|uniref:Alpha-ketoglutarate-dependent dioxygenase AlkB-like domain-containing protein n=1 Tax=Parelaphostrongylus tenuis TaxID=148309 RepID=A0AAD5MNX5_PARTN|nr:hypothetical protein KIN20_007287 [Parelaphostrongylus tenuis]
MWCRIIGNHSRNTKRNLIGAKLICFANTRLFMTKEMEKSIPRTNNISTVGNYQEKKDHYGSDTELQSSLLKKTFKYYKRRVPPPDFSGVIDPSSSGTCEAFCSQQLLPEHVGAAELEQLGLKPFAEWKVVTIKGRLGLYIIPNLLRKSMGMEKAILDSVLPTKYSQILSESVSMMNYSNIWDEAVEIWLRRVFQYAEPPNITNLTAHGLSPKRNVLKEAGKSLRWTTLGVAYNWETKEYPRTGDDLPAELVHFAKVITRVLGLGTMDADAAIVNYYPPKSTLSPHVDRSERTDAPLVSLSLGQSAVYLRRAADH